MKKLIHIILINDFFTKFTKISFVFISKFKNIIVLKNYQKQLYTDNKLGSKTNFKYNMLK